LVLHETMNETAARFACWPVVLAPSPPRSPPLRLPPCTPPHRLPPGHSPSPPGSAATQAPAARQALLAASTPAAGGAPDPAPLPPAPVLLLLLLPGRLDRPSASGVTACSWPAAARACSRPAGPGRRTGSCSTKHKRQHAVGGQAEGRQRVL
jgi:hypothetical protein